MLVLLPALATEELLEVTVNIETHACQRLKVAVQCSALSKPSVTPAPENIPGSGQEKDGRT